MFRSIAGQISLLVTLPIIGILVLGGVIMFFDWSDMREFQRTEPKIALVEDTVALIAALQRERGLTAGHLSNADDAAARQRLDGQRVETDALIGTFLADSTIVLDRFHDKPFVGVLEMVIGEMDKITEHRSFVDMGGINLAGNLAFYSELVKGQILLVAQTIESIEAAAVSEQLRPFFALTEFVENAGLERALGATVLNEVATGSVNEDRFRAFIVRGARAAAYFDEFYELASPAQVAQMDAALDPAMVGNFEAALETINALPSTRDSDGLTGSAFFALATERIDAINGVGADLLATAHQVTIDMAAENLRALLGLGAIIGVATLALIGFTAWRVGKLTRRLNGSVAALSAIADGDLDHPIDDTEAQDEIGAVGRALLVFRDNAVERRRLRDQSEAEREAREERNRRIETLIATFREDMASMLQQVAGATQEMDATAQALNGIADTANHQAAAAAGASEEASTNVQTVASAAEELASSIEEIGRQVRQADDVSQQASTRAEATNSQVASLAEAAKRIGDVVSLIQDIAEQTNLLALNATIEAARAGEAGRGFAVVASEVKTLASQTAKATEEIRGQIEGIQASTEDAVDAIGAIREIMTEVGTYTASIASAVEQQASATSEISRNVQEAASGTEVVSENISGVTGAVGETSQSSAQVASATAELANQAEKLRSTVDRFLDEVAAA